MTLSILFISGAFEIGRCGVSDQFFLLSKALSRHGVVITCIALNDSCTDIDLPLLVNRSRIDGINILRFSSAFPWRLRSNALRAEINDFKPDWISLQYVPFAFHSKGLPFCLIQCLASVKYHCKWHVMVHELWVDPSQSIRHRLLYYLQRQIFRLLCIILHPRLVHTSNHWYQGLLSSVGVKSALLPLFSNIAYVPVVSLKKTPTQDWTFLFFGAINMDWQPEELFHQIEIARRKKSILSCKFVSVGNLGDYGTKLWDSFEQYSSPAFQFFRFGKLSQEIISEHLQKADFGISVSPSHLIDKSSSTAAMLSHGLPVIITRLTPDCNEWHAQLKKSGKFILLDDTFLDSLLTTKRYPPRDILEDTATVFLQSLQDLS
ncbi:MAG: hypothetical protein ACK6AD_06035 [Cyanobacteriota bacterium]|jgi:hypothetical protein